MRQLPVKKRADRSNRATWKRHLQRGLLLGGGLFVVANVAMWGMYRDRVLPNYTLGNVPVGGVSYAELDTYLADRGLLPAQITFGSDSQTQRLTPRSLGITADNQASIAALRASRPWLPVVSLFTDRIVPAHITVDAEAFANGAEPVMVAFSKAAQPNHVVFATTKFTVAPAADGRQVVASDLQQAVELALRQGKQTVAVPTRVVKPPKDKDLSGEVARLQKQLTATVQLVYQGKRHKLSASDMGSWYVADGQSMAPSPDRIKAQAERVAASFGITAQNAGEAATASVYALHNATKLDFRLVSTQAPRTFHYCAAQRGANDAVLGDFRLKLAATFGDVRGWNNDGRIAFVAGDGQQCDFTIWLSAADSMSSFGGICDAFYSCRVDSNVVINYDRWRYATDPWNKAGLSVADYQVLVVNHETGHWLGFGHLPCTGPGNPAPVMMQQSIDLGGCKLNPWPVPSELATLNQYLNIASTPDRRRDYAMNSGGCPCGSPHG